ncbi:OmpA family protein [Pontibacter sp. JH31]|uniref:OmpA family protein n=1 Tax=Pontibacter aquaedesilientis TaxID=2766980 RepID=A0ABR7XBG8_9BACT|nr:OmpA family protein [Pontibacter aquaedesilientis]MBD1395632.1 OmpA family protein [Pontibacter aquaedesilientis]
MKATLLYLLFSLYLVQGVAQNLVRNPSLEDRKKGIVGFRGISGTPDIASVANKVVMYPPYFNAYLSETPSRQVTNIAFGEVCLCQWFSSGASELAQAELTRPLQKNKEYLVSLYTIRASTIEPPISAVTVHFTTRPIPATRQVYGLKDHPLTGLALPYLSLRPNTGNPLSSREVWTKVSAVYKANGGERYLLIGNFIGANREALETMNPEEEANPQGGRVKGTYYCYDNISVVPRAEAEPEATDQAIAETGGKILREPFSVGKTLTLEDVNFSSGEHHILAVAYPMLDSLSAFLMAEQEAVVQVQGHTDNVGEEAANMNLSIRRAQAVKAYLTNSGIAAERISTRGFGETQPKTDNSTEKNRAMNRRVEIVIRGQR